MRAPRLAAAAWMRAVLVAALALAAPASASAQSLLPDLSLEDLMKLDGGQVYGASERLQPVTEAPASVSFITADEIKRFGYRTLADVLQAVRGFYITNDRNFSYVGARGFSKPGDYNSRILLLVNGHRVNDNIFGQAELGMEFGLDPATFERVEIIRGPASSLYGDSAFFAVVNVITRTGAALDGVTVAADVGTLGTRLARVTAGTRFANGVDVALAGTYEYIGGADRLYFPEFDAPETNHGIAEKLDADDARQVYGRLAYRGLTFTGAYGTRTKLIPTASFGTVFNEQESREETTDTHVLLDAEYVRSIGGSRVALRGAFDRFAYNGTYHLAPRDESGFNPVGKDAVRGSRWSASARVTRSLRARQTLTAGAEFIDNLQQDNSSRYVDPPIVVFESKQSTLQFAAYAQDEIRPKSWLILNGGLRYDRYEDFERVSPRGAVIVIPSSNYSIKYLYGRAFRAPNRYELNEFYFGSSVRRLNPEAIDTHELVWEGYPNDRIRTSVSGYWYKADQLITLVADPESFLGVTFLNQAEVRATGLELEAQVRLPWRAQALVSYAVQRARDRDTDAILPNSPSQMVKARFSVPLARTGTTLSADVQGLSSRLTIVGTTVPAATLVNVTALQPIGRRWEIVATARNLFDVDYGDPGSAQHQQLVIPREGRTVRVGLRLKLWTP